MSRTINTAPAHIQALVRPHDEHHTCSEHGRYLRSDDSVCDIDLRDGDPSRRRFGCRRWPHHYGGRRRGQSEWATTFERRARAAVRAQIAEARKLANEALAAGDLDELDEIDVFAPATNVNWYIW